MAGTSGNYLRVDTIDVDPRDLSTSSTYKSPINLDIVPHTLKETTSPPFLTPSRKRRSFRIAIICELVLEANMVELLFDQYRGGEIDRNCGKALGDRNTYHTGTIAGQNVVLVYSSDKGGTIAADLRSSFPNIEIAFLVGTCGVVPTHSQTNENIILGDCVVATKVIEYDFGRQYPKGFRREEDHTLNGHRRRILSHEIRQERGIYHKDLTSQFTSYLRKLLETNPGITRPSMLEDCLFQPSYPHSHVAISGTCQQCHLETGTCTKDCKSVGCEDKYLVVRHTESETHPRIHFGNFLSTNIVLKSGEYRDILASADDIVAFTTESLRLWNLFSFPTIIIKSACDYADGHKNKDWQAYTAASAAAALRAAMSEMEILKGGFDIKGLAAKRLYEYAHPLSYVERQRRYQASIHETATRCLQALCPSLYYQDIKDSIPSPGGDTCTWALSCKTYSDWVNNEEGCLLVTAAPGCGKSVLAKYLIDHQLPPHTNGGIVCYYFFKCQIAGKLAPALAAILHQILSVDKNSLFEHAMPVYQKHGKEMSEDVNIMTDLLCRIIGEQPSRQIVLVIDGLDEYQQDDFERLNSILKRLRKAQNVKILLTSCSRDTISAELDLEGSWWLHIPSEKESKAIGKEISLFITECLRNLRSRTPLEEPEFQALSNQLLSTQDRTYLWAYLVCSELEVLLKERREISQKFLSMLPKSVREAYRRTLDRSRSDEKARQLVPKIFDIMLTATQLLTVRELQVRLKTKFSPKDSLYIELDMDSQEQFTFMLRYWCGSLIQIHHGRITFVHQTAREFLGNGCFSYDQFWTSIAGEHETAAESILSDSSLLQASGDALSSILLSLSNTGSMFDSVIDPGAKVDASDQKASATLIPAETVVSDSSSIVSNEDFYMSSFMKDLCSRILDMDDVKIPLDFVQKLSSLIKIFSLQLGYTGATDHHRQAMKYLYMRSERIARGLEHSISINETTNDLRDSGPGMLPEEKIDLLWRGGERAPNPNLDTKVSQDAEVNGGEGGMPLEEEIELLWQGGEQGLDLKLDMEVSQDVGTNRKEGDMIEDDSEDDQDHTATETLYTRLIKQSVAYTWLVECILNEFRLTELSTANTRKSITEKILNLRSRILLSSRRDPPSMGVLITFDWDLEGFIRYQSQSLKSRVYSMEDEDTAAWIWDNTSVISLDSMEYTITLTGDATCVQALTCKEYLQLVWPRTGLRVLDVLKHATRITGQRHKETLLNKTYLCATNVEGHFSVEINGEAYAVAEVVNILAWITSALRLSSRRSGLCSIEPFIEVLDSGSLDVEPSVQHESLRHNLLLAYRDDEIPRQSIGSCWHDMFNNPVVVSGYPIRQRNESEVGLETTTNIISTVMQTQRWNLYNSKLYIKAFSAMLIPTKRNSRSLLWHYIYDMEGEYLWFEREGDTVTHDTSVTPEDLETRRHFIGWCSKARSNVGAAGVCHNIQEAELNRPKSSFALRAFAVSAGHFGVSAGLSVSLSHKDLPIRIPLSGSGFVEKIRWASAQSVLLWDTIDRRGWLVDGASALLHLVRTTLESLWAEVEWEDAILLERDQITEPNTTMPDQPKFTSYPNAAIQFFILERLKNMRLEVEIHSLEKHRKVIGDIASENETPVKETYVLLGDVVEHLLDILASAVYAPSYLKDRDGEHFQAYHSEHLDGWDFKSLATRHVQFQPVTQTFPCWALPWVELLRSIEAVTLFGTGFGELIEPYCDESLCPHWQKLPTGKNFFAVCYTTLAKIMKHHQGKPKNTPIQLTPRFIWYNQIGHDTTSAVCASHGCIDPKDMVQVIWEKTTKWPWNRPSSITHSSRLSEDGAIIFGYPDDRTKRYLKQSFDQLLKQCFGAEPVVKASGSTEEAFSPTSEPQDSTDGEQTSLTPQRSDTEPARTVTELTSLDSPVGQQVGASSITPMPTESKIRDIVYTAVKDALHRYCT